MEICPRTLPRSRVKVHVSRHVYPFKEDSRMILRPSEDVPRFLSRYFSASRTRVSPTFTTPSIWTLSDIPTLERVSRDVGEGTF